MVTGKRAYITIIWLYFIAITIAELLTIFLAPWVGLICHGIILIAFIIQPSFINDTDIGNLVLGLILIPLIRIISLTLPIINLPQMFWYPLIYIPLLVACIMVIRTIKIPLGDIGLTRNSLLIQLPIGIVLGIIVGTIEYFILQPISLVPDFTLGQVLVPAIIIFFTTGLVEELIFRGVLQHLALNAMGITGIIYVSLIFAVLHVGFYSITDVVFIFCISLVFSTIVKKTGSLYGVILSHGIANIILFLVAPFFITPGFQLP